METNEIDSELSELASRSRRRVALHRFLRLAALFVAGTVAALLIATRNDPALRIATTERILRWEREHNSQLTFPRAIFGIDLKATDSALFDAIARQDDTALSILLDVGLSPNVTNSVGKSALRVAVEKRNRAAINLLVARGCDVNFVDKDGKTALYAAIQENDVDLVLHLLVFGADSNTLSLDGKLPLAVAVQEQNLPITEILLERGADANAVDAEGKPHLIRAVERDNPSIVSALMGKNANINTVDREGKTALMYAVLADNVPMVGVLLQANPNLELRDSKGKSVADYAKERGGRVGPLFARVFGAPPEETVTPKGAESPTTEEQVVEQPGNGFIRAPKESVGSRFVSRSGRTGTGSFEEDTRPKLTRLRVVGKIEGTWEKGKKLSLRSVRIVARNVGIYPAEEIVVKVKVPGGTVLNLVGPQSLAPNATAEFTAENSVDVVQAGNLKAELLCSNCHR